MRIEIDQSIKIEATNKSTVIAFSNAKCGAIVITSKEKKSLQKYFRLIGKPRFFIYLSFAALIYLLIKDNLSNNNQIVIDTEYLGYEKFIKQKLNEIIMENSKVRNIHIYSARIGKKSPAHIIAYSALKKKLKVKAVKIYAKDVLKIVKRNLKSGNA